MPIIRKLVEKISGGHEHNTYEVAKDEDTEVLKLTNLLKIFWRDLSPEAEEENLQIIDEDGINRPKEKILQNEVFETQEGVQIRVGMAILMEYLKDLEKSLVGPEELMEEEGERGRELIEIYKNLIITCHKRYNHPKKPRGHDLSGGGALRNLIDAYIQTGLLKISEYLPSPMQEEIESRCPGIYWKFYNYPVIDGKLTCIDTGLLDIEGSNPVIKPILSWLYHMQIAGTIELLTICAKKHNERYGKPLINVEELKNLQYDGSPFQRKTAIEFFNTMFKMMDRRKLMENKEQKNMFPEAKGPFLKILNTIDDFRKRFEPYLDLYIAKIATEPRLSPLTNPRSKN